MPASLRILLAGALLMLVPLNSRAANETELERLWEQHLARPDDHAAVIAACQRFVALDAGDPFTDVVSGIETWHLLRSGKAGEATPILQSHLIAKPSLILSGATAVAKGWQTRLDRERVVKALQLFYRKEVGYPASLADLIAHPKVPKEQHPPLNDRFGNPWQYRLVGIKGLPTMQDQRYELLSTALGDQSPLEVALEAPYGFGIDLIPEAVFPALNPPQVSFKNPAGGGATAIPLGRSAGGLYLAYIGNQIVIVCNHSYWKIFSRP